MMAFDMGGPLNKAAYVFAAGGFTIAITEGGPGLQIMAAVMAAGMTPPLGMAVATLARKKLWTEAERENGLACWLLGASFITEGAIPFAAAHPLRVIPSCMAGSAVTGAMVMAFGNELRAPHGGIFVLPLISNPVPVSARHRGRHVDHRRPGHRADEPGSAEDRRNRARRRHRRGRCRLTRFRAAHHRRGCDDVCRSPGRVSELTRSIG